MKRPGIEVAKWIGLAAMLYDHLAYFSGWPLPLASAIGALAFPFFAVALAAGLSSSENGKHQSIIKRLLVGGVIAQVAVCLVRDPLPLNVLFTLASGVMVYSAAEAERGGKQFAVFCLGLSIGTLSEFTFVGTAMVATLMGHYRMGTKLWIPVAIALPLFAFNEGMPFAPLAVWLAVLCVQYAPELPRVKRIFYPVYVLQYPFLRML